MGGTCSAQKCKGLAELMQAKAKAANSPAEPQQANFEFESRE
jgi:hypothetical protein